MFARFLAIAVALTPAHALAEATAPLTAAEINERILAVKQAGETVQLPGFNPATFPLLHYVKTPLPSPQYLISDDPEYIRVPEAIAMQEDVAAGDVRLYVYNVNGVREPAKIDRKISVVLENKGSAPLELRFSRRTLQGPSGNYFEQGKLGLRGFFGSTPESEVRTIPVGGAVPLDPNMEAAVAKYDDLVHGFYEFNVSQPARISVVQTAPETPSPEVLTRVAAPLPPKSKSGAGRGKFLTNNYDITLDPGVTLDSAMGPTQIIVADGKIDPWVTGTDSTTTTTATLKGNYGVIYNFTLDRKIGDPRGLALIMWNARHGGKWCDGMAATVEVSEGKFPAGLVGVPSDQLNLAGPPAHSVVQVFPPLAPGQSQRITIRYSPPGASCLPTPLAFVPVDF